jgi:hypothetical protein
MLIQQPQDVADSLTSYRLNFDLIALVLREPVNIKECEGKGCHSVDASGMLTLSPCEDTIFQGWRRIDSIDIILHYHIDGRLLLCNTFKESYGLR